MERRLLLIIIYQGRNHNDVIKWKHFPRYWPLVRGIHWSPGNSPAQRPVTRSFDILFDLHLNKRLSKQSHGWRFETPSCSLWRHYDVFHYICVASCVSPCCNNITLGVWGPYWLWLSVWRKQWILSSFLWITGEHIGMNIHPERQYSNLCHIICQQ